MKITFITSGLQLSGGTLHTIEFANRLARKGHSVSIVLPRGYEDDTVNYLETCISLIRTKTHFSSFSAGNNIRLAFQLAKITPTSNCLIATYTPTAIPTLIASWAMKKGTPFWLFADYVEMFRNRPVERWTMRLAPHFFRKILVVSQSCRETIREQAGTESIVVGMGLTRPEMFVPNPRTSPITEQEKEILFTGDPRPRKGLGDFIEAVKLVYREENGIRVSIASKQDFPVDDGLPISFFHRPSDTQLASLYAKCDVFVSASWFEGFGLPPLEAMACGAPVVLTDSHGIREYAVHEENCLIVPPKDPSALASAILRLLRDPELHSRLSLAGQRTAARFTLEEPAARLEKALFDN